jgi:polyhydroxyalkanoate synthesis regulator phasin
MFSAFAWGDTDYWQSPVDENGVLRASHNANLKIEGLEGNVTGLLGFRTLQAISDPSLTRALTFLDKEGQIDFEMLSKGDPTSEAWKKQANLLGNALTLDGNRKKFAEVYQTLLKKGYFGTNQAKAFDKVLVGKIADLAKLDSPQQAQINKTDIRDLLEKIRHSAMNPDSLRTAVSELEERFSKPEFAHLASAVGKLLALQDPKFFPEGTREQLEKFLNNEDAAKIRSSLTKPQKEAAFVSGMEGLRTGDINSAEWRTKADQFAENFANKPDVRDLYAAVNKPYENEGVSLDYFPPKVKEEIEKRIGDKWSDKMKSVYENTDLSSAFVIANRMRTFGRDGLDVSEVNVWNTDRASLSAELAKHIPPLTGAQFATLLGGDKFFTTAELQALSSTAAMKPPVVGVTAPAAAAAVSTEPAMSRPRSPFTSPFETVAANKASPAAQPNAPTAPAARDTASLINALYDTNGLSNLSKPWVSAALGPNVDTLAHQFIANLKYASTHPNPNAYLGYAYQDLKQKLSNYPTLQAVLKTVHANSDLGRSFKKLDELADKLNPKNGIFLSRPESDKLAAAFKAELAHNSLFSFLGKTINKDVMEALQENHKKPLAGDPTNLTNLIQTSTTVAQAAPTPTEIVYADTVYELNGQHWKCPSGHHLRTDGYCWKN